MPEAKDRRILVVDDDDAILQLVAKILTGAGYEVVAVHGGEEALSAFRADPFDLVLTDLAMPDMSGIQIIKAVKNNLGSHHIPTLVLTAHWLDRLSQQAEAMGCDGFIFKPFTKEELLRLVAEKLGH